ncbi:MAG: cbb3-type cytochrome c oxidase subunit II [Gemmatimonadaceae bacterium]|nr:cbb3-type cytochrome c oxidase subunit II [Gemmatimonadaceae bacterium]
MSGEREVSVFRLWLGAVAIIGLATALLVVAPYASLKDVAPPEGLNPYTASQLRGRQVYIANGCVYCHSQQPRDPSVGPDQQRGWGRPSVPGDYHYDAPHLLGTMRTGPDLFNIAVRQPSRDWHLGHLYQPRAYLPGSIMPAYPFLFERRRGSEAQPGEVVLALPPGVAPEGMRVVASDDAIALVDYLLALDRSYPVLPPTGGR